MFTMTVMLLITTPFYVTGIKHRLTFFILTYEQIQFFFIGTMNKTHDGIPISCEMIIQRRIFMIPEQRQALDEIISKIRSGRMKRRTFLERATAIGLTSSVAMSLLEACGGTTNSTGGNGQTTNVVWQSEQDATSTYKDLAEAFNQTIGNQKGVHVTWQNGPINTNDMLTKYNNMFRARDASIDIVSIDIVYPAQFAANQWVAPISDKWPASERTNYLQGPVLGCTFEGKVWAAPYRTDI